MNSCRTLTMISIGGSTVTMVAVTIRRYRGRLLIVLVTCPTFVMTAQQCGLAATSSGYRHRP